MYEQVTETDGILFSNCYVSLFVVSVYCAVLSRPNHTPRKSKKSFLRKSRKAISIFTYINQYE